MSVSCPAADDPVVAVAGAEQVVARSARQPVVARVAIQAVVARGAVERVVAGSARERVAPVPAEDAVAAPLPVALSSVTSRTVMEASGDRRSGAVGHLHGDAVQVACS